MIRSNLLKIFITFLSFLPLLIYGQGQGSSFLRSYTDTPQEILLLEGGSEALLKRIDLIRKAKREIILEYFIFRPDTAGKIIMIELLKKAKEGVKVRLLIDKSFTVFQLDEYYAQVLGHRLPFEIRYYNRALNPITMQFRNHRKVLAIDGVEAIIGGRNIGNEYFAMDADYNFLDRDVWLKGEVVLDITKSFNIYWNNSIVQKAKNPNKRDYNSLFHQRNSLQRYKKMRAKVNKRRMVKVHNWIKDQTKAKSIIQRLEQSVRRSLDSKQSSSCQKLTFVSDFPGARFSDFSGVKYWRKYRRVGDEIKKHMRRAQKSIFISSPYFILNKPKKSVIKNLLEKGVDVQLITNSLASTDAVYVASHLYAEMDEWLAHGLKLFLYDSSWLPDEWPLVYAAKKARWGTHSKSFIIDDETIFIGTYNLDNRSDFFNTELGIFCEKSPEVAMSLKKAMKRRKEMTFMALPGEEAIDHNNQKVDIFGGASAGKIKLMKAITRPVLWLEGLL